VKNPGDGVPVHAGASERIHRQEDNRIIFGGGQ
jgi:hypothetical protein